MVAVEILTSFREDIYRRTLSLDWVDAFLFHVRQQGLVVVISKPITAKQHDIMKAAGLTHGGFYGHFESKDDLAAEACARALRREWWKVATESSRAGGLEAIVRRYLSPQHRSDRSHGCLFAAVGSDVVRQPRAVRRAVTKGFESMIEGLRSFMPGRSAAARRKKALTTMTGLVGAPILSRAVDDPTLSDEILEAAASTLGRPQAEAS